MMMFVIFLIMLSGLIIYSSMRDHLISMLLSLEFMVLGLFLFLVVSMVGGDMYYCLFYLVMSACEGALGLSILVSMSRSYGGDYLNSFSFLMK